ncbi:hypothetical protein, partial [Streptomyces sp. NPDC048845]|uniref:hypothetical protein n=1 Tax=Streptomyces sp. NPDC048845 TaxID=3155390 RepID=UPI003439B4FF
MGLTSSVGSWPEAATVPDRTAPGTAAPGLSAPAGRCVNRPPVTAGWGPRGQSFRSSARRARSSRICSERASASASAHAVRHGTERADSGPAAGSNSASLQVSDALGNITLVGLSGILFVAAG